LFGLNDLVTLRNVKQAGTTGVVNALHCIFHGTVWTLEEIQELKPNIEESG